MKSASLNQRKLDTRRKIEMGGLVIKSELDYLFDKDKELLLGALLYLKDLLHSENSNSTIEQFKQLFKKFGNDAFKK